MPETLLAKQSIIAHELAITAGRVASGATSIDAIGILVATIDLDAPRARFRRGCRVAHGGDSARTTRIRTTGAGARVRRWNATGARSDTADARLDAFYRELIRIGRLA